VILAADASRAGFFETVSPHLVSFVVIVVVVAVLIGVNRLFLRVERSGERNRFRKQATMLALTLVGVIVVVLTLPVKESTTGQLLTLFGLAITAALTLSSTSFVANMMAGLMLRSVNSFRPGYFIRVGEQFGRVTERGLFHVEIQTEDRDLCTLPNLYVMTNPVRVVSPEGTIVSATVSLGYDTHHTHIEKLLLEATETAGLSDGFVQIVELGDFSVSYRTAGFLPRVRHLVTARSNLRRAMLDSLHRGGVEIVSPAFMNQRPLEAGSRVIPKGPWRADVQDQHNGAAPEELMFEKADEAEKIESLRERREAAVKAVESIKAEIKSADGEAEHERLTTRLGQQERYLAAVEKRIAEHEDA